MSPYESSIRGMRRMSRNESLKYSNEKEKVNAAIHVVGSRGREMYSL